MRVHVELSLVVMSTSKSICWICYKVAAPSLKAIIRHMAAVHGHDPGFYVCCGIEGCPRTYSNFYSFKKHLYRKHRCHLEMTGPFEINSLLDNTEENTVEIEEELDDDESEVLSKFQHMKQMALFLLKTKELRKVSQVALDGLVADFTSILQMTIHQLKCKVESVLKDNGVSITTFEGLLTVFQDPQLNEPFKELSSKYLQERFYREHLNILEPIGIKLGQRMVLERRVSRPYLKVVHDYVYYVPFLESLHHLLSDSLVFEEVMRGHKRTDGLLSDYCDGSDFNSHPLFSSEQNALQILLYFDEVEVCNPLGTKVKTHKLGLFYYILGNLSPSLRSQLRSIQLLAVAKAPTIVKYGADTVLEPFMNDLKKLEEDGITIVTDGQSQTLKGTVSLISGDNLASHYLGGNKAPSGSLRKCRHCMATSDNMQTQFTASSFQQRSRDTHAYHCSLLNGPLREHVATTYGIQRDSILNTSNFFHVTEGLVPDIMHDVLEGCAPYETKELLKYLNGKGIVTLKYINGQIKCFPYAPPDVRNKPTPIPETTFKSSDHSVKQKAGQMWCLLRLLPLMLGDKVPETDSRWKNFLMLLEIVDYVFAPTLSEDHVAYIHVLIEEHHQAFVDLYPSCNITPKLHYMVHYPQWISRCGPLSRFWCMRFESRHNYFKDLAHRVRCFKNIPQTLACHNQRLTCLQSNSDSCLIKDTVTGPDVDGTCNYTDLESIFPDTTSIKRVRWIEVLGTTYKPGGIVILSVDLVPNFGLICDILVSDVNNYFLVCETLHTECFCHHYHAYKVEHESPPSHVFVKQSDLADHSILGLYKSQYIVLKYHVI